MDRYTQLETQLRNSCPNLTLLQEEPMSRHTSFQIGGPVRLMALPDSEETLAEALRAARKVGITPYLLGNGTNLLCQDEPMDCFVLKTTHGLTRLELLDETTIACGAGISLARLAGFAQQHGLTGLEFAAGIPGSLGGGIVMNAGAYGSEMKAVLVSCRHVAPDGTVAVREGEALALGYRRSAYTDSGEVILSLKLRLEPGDPEEIRRVMDDLLNRRREKQPLEYPSAGSVFKRPPGNFAGTLIEQCGLKGYTIGGAQVSEKHAGFIINRGGATCSDVRALCAHIQNEVFVRTSIRLETEIKTIGR